MGISWNLCFGITNFNRNLNCAPTIQDFGDGRAKTCLYGPSYTISKGDRIAQLVLQAVPTALFIKTSDISKIGEDRNGGFGSTGVK